MGLKTTSALQNKAAGFGKGKSGSEHHSHAKKPWHAEMVRRGGPYSWPRVLTPLHKALIAHSGVGNRNTNMGRETLLPQHLQFCCNTRARPHIHIGLQSLRDMLFERQVRVLHWNRRDVRGTTKITFAVRSLSRYEYDVIKACWNHSENVAH